MKANDFFKDLDVEQLGRNFDQTVEIVNKSLAAVPADQRAKYTDLISSVNKVNRELKDKGFDPENLSGLEKLNDSLTKKCKDMGA
jgi:predicted Zn-dependent protease with MMP-like domain